MTNKRKVFPIGSSLAVTLPKSWCKQNGVTSGTTLSINETEDALIISINEQPEAEEPELVTIEAEDIKEPAAPQSTINIDAIIRRQLAIAGGDY